ncbi:hypothetical protein [Streptomyces sp. SP18CS02]|nr:hypothetical protein [Streptomyces sp. SP18CS02]MEE1752871.1 hypothetical protein [Streptomyces sp. SP18CS02]
MNGSIAGGTRVRKRAGNLIILGTYEEYRRTNTANGTVVAAQNACTA